MAGRAHVSLSSCVSPCAHFLLSIHHFCCRIVINCQLFRFCVKHGGSFATGYVQRSPIWTCEQSLLFSEQSGVTAVLPVTPSSTSVRSLQKALSATAWALARSKPQKAERYAQCRAKAFPAIAMPAPVSRGAWDSTAKSTGELMFGFADRLCAAVKASAQSKS